MEPTACHGGLTTLFKGTGGAAERQAAPPVPLKESSYMTDNLHLQAEELRLQCETLLQNIAGVENLDIKRHENLFDRDGTPEFSVSFTGWSPSLHRISIRVREHASDEASKEKTFVRLMAKCRTTIERQGRRAEAAAKLGYHHNLPNGRVEHLQIDEAMIAIARDGGTDLMGSVRNAIGKLHDRMAIDHGGRVLSRVDMMVVECGEQDRLRCVAPTIKIRRDGQVVGRHSGPWIRINANHLPETTLTALIGRPVKDLVHLHGALDDRIIQRAENRSVGKDKEIVLGIDLHLQPISTLAA